MSSRLPSRPLPGGALLFAAAFLAAPLVAQNELLTSTSYPAGFGPADVAVIDIDGDGDNDILAIGQFSSSVEVLLGDGSGSFVASTPTFVGSQPVALAVGDFNGDSFPDVATADAGSSSVTVLAGFGDGTLVPLSVTPVSALPQDLAAGDVDGDGVLDLVLAHDSQATPISVLFGDGSGSFPVTTVLGSGFCATSLELADLDNDGDLELLATDITNDSLRLWVGSGAGNGSSFAAGDSHPVGLDPRGIAVGDLDHDGMLDVIVAGSASDEISVLLAGAPGAFEPPQNHTVGATPRAVRIADINGDQLADVIVASSGTGEIGVLLGDGAGGLESPQSTFSGVFPSALVIADVDRDFFADVIVANQFTHDVAVMLNQSGPWVDLGGGIGGAWGDSLLVLGGHPAEREPVTLTALGVPGGNHGLLFAGLQRIDLPFMGGLLIPEPVVIAPMRAQVSLGFVWPDTLPPGLDVFAQAWFQVGVNVTGTGALRIVTQHP